MTGPNSCFRKCESNGSETWVGKSPARPVRFRRVSSKSRWEGNQGLGCVGGIGMETKGCCAKEKNRSLGLERESEEEGGIKEFSA